MPSATTAPLVAAAGARPRLAIPASQPFARSIGVASALPSRLVEGLRTRRSHDRKQRAKLLTRAGALARLPFTIDPDMLRHASGFKLANDGHATRSLQHYLGHKNIAHTVRYTLSPLAWAAMPNRRRPARIGHEETLATQVRTSRKRSPWTGRRVEAARTGRSRESSERSSSRISNQSSIRGGPATAWSAKLMMVVYRLVLRVRSRFSEG